MQLKPIVWQEGNYNFEHGYVGKLHLFTVGHDGMRAKGEEEDKPYILTSQLPGIARRRIESAGKGKMLAYILLQRWIEHLMENKNEDI